MKTGISHRSHPAPSGSNEHIATANQAQIAVEAVVRASAQVERRMGNAALVSLCNQVNYDVVLPGNVPTLSLLRALSALTTHSNSCRRIHVLFQSDTPAEQVALARKSGQQNPRVEVHIGERGESVLAILNDLIPRLERDLVWLHPEAEFGADLLARLRRCQEQNENLAAAAPLCNRGDALSLCCLDRAALESEAGQGINELIAQCASQLYPRVPATHDACVLIARSAFIAIGGFNTELSTSVAFVEWCQRAWLCGYECALCDDAFVDDRRPALPRAEQQRLNILQVRFPDYLDVVRDLQWLDPLRIQRLRISDRLHHRTSATKLLIVSPQESLANYETDSLRGIAEHLGDEYSITWLQTGGLDAQAAEARIRGDRARTLVMPADLQAVRNTIRGSTLDVRSPRVEQWFSDVLHGTGPDVVHFRGMRDLGSFLLPSIARAAGAHVVLSLHDYFLICPNWQLTYADGRACEQNSCLTCMQTESCLSDLRWQAPGTRPLPLPSYLGERQRWARVALDAAHVIVVPSQRAKASLCAAFGQEFEPRICVVPAGAHVADAAGLRAPRREQERRLKLAFLGPATSAAGLGLITHAIRQLSPREVEWLVLDSPPTALTYPESIRFLGPCPRESWHEHLSDVDAVLLPTLAEPVDSALVEDALLLGLPVIAARSGAFIERVLDGETGLLFDPGSTAGFVDALRRFLDDRALREHLRTQVCAVPIRTHSHELEALRNLYAGVRQQGLSRRSSTLDLMENFRSRHKRAGAA